MGYGLYSTRYFIYRKPKDRSNSYYHRVVVLWPQEICMWSTQELVRTATENTIFPTIFYEMVHREKEGTNWWCSWRGLKSCSCIYNEYIQWWKDSKMIPEWWSVTSPLLSSLQLGWQALPALRHDRRRHHTWQATTILYEITIESQFSRTKSY